MENSLAKNIQSAAHKLGINTELIDEFGESYLGFSNQREFISCLVEAMYVASLIRDIDLIVDIRDLSSSFRIDKVKKDKVIYYY